MVLNATFIIFQLYRGGQFLLMQKTGVHGKSHASAANHWQTLLHSVVSSTLHHDRDSRSHHVSGDIY